MKNLNKYYNEKVKVKGMPEFKDLAESNKRQLKNSIGFAGYNVTSAVKEFGEACKPFLGKDGLLKD